MRAWKLLYDFTPEANATAIGLLEEAVAHDPNSAEAHFVLALIHYHGAHMGFVEDRQSSRLAAHRHAQRATRLDDPSEYAYWSLGLSYWGLGKLDEAIASMERAIETKSELLSCLWQPRDDPVPGRPDRRGDCQPGNRHSFQPA